MKIDLLCNDGSPLGVTERTIFGDSRRVGVGGAEYAMLTLCAEWTKAGHTVRLYNDPWEKDASSFEQLPIHAYNPNDNRDAIIVVRSPNLRVIPSKGMKIWFSMDQQTVGDFAQFSTAVDKIVCISPFHAKYFRERYNITNTTIIDLPIRLQDFDGLKFDRVKNRLIFTSVPARGSENFLRMYKSLKQSNPEITATITSDYRLWGVEPSDMNFRVRWSQQNDVRYLGAVSRGKLLEELLSADLMLYPCNYDELFCIAVAEAQCAGLCPVTSYKGALETTNMANVQFVDPDNPVYDGIYVNAVLDLLSDRNVLEIKRAENKVRARMRFAPEKILEQWDREIFNGR